MQQIKRGRGLKMHKGGRGGESKQRGRQGGMDGGRVN